MHSIDLIEAAKENPNLRAALIRIFGHRDSYFLVNRFMKYGVGFAEPDVDAADEDWEFFQLVRAEILEHEMEPAVLEAIGLGNTTLSRILRHVYKQAERDADLDSLTLGTIRAWKDRSWAVSRGVTEARQVVDQQIRELLEGAEDEPSLALAEPA